MRPKFVAGNWKMFTSRAGAKHLAAGVARGLEDEKRVLVAVCPPFPWLITVRDMLEGTPVALGGQDCHYEKEGAFTGSVSPTMLADLGCTYVIVGHSERRHGLGETDELLNKKCKAGLAAGLHVIFCIGELLAERDANQTESVLDRQMTHGLAGIPADQVRNLVIAYEPVWAIGTGRNATPQQAQDAHAFIRQKFAKMYGENAANALLIQYGGSVKPDNAAVLMSQPDVDGALVGGASLKADGFLAIVKAAAG
ncbi:MAG: triose-phosphate isomerase [Gemmataceae bacterium]